MKTIIPQVDKIIVEKVYATGEEVKGIFVPELREKYIVSAIGDKSKSQLDRPLVPDVNVGDEVVIPYQGKRVIVNGKEYEVVDYNEIVAVIKNE